MLNLFNDLLNIILTDKTSELEIQEDKNKNQKVESRKVESKKVENEKVESRKEENENGNEDEDGGYENENEYDFENEDVNDETMSQNKKNEIINNLNDNLDKIIDKSKSFEE